MMKVMMKEKKRKKKTIHKRPGKRKKFKERRK